MSIVPFNTASMDMAMIDTRDARDIAPHVIGPDGVMQPVPAAFYAETTVAERAVLGQRRGIYGFLTDELIDWLRERIGGRKAIEIGAGHGALARALTIPATDSKMQDDPMVAALYRATGQPTVKYGPNVEKLDAKAAIRKHRPEVVIASWVTHKYRESRHHAGGNMFGVNEEEVIARCEYIFIGNQRVHAGKSIWDAPHEIITPDWLYSRAHNGTPEFIAVWEKQR